jgi:hypothetical protein
VLKKISNKLRVQTLAILAVSIGLVFAFNAGTAGAVSAPNTLKVSPVRSDINVKQGDKRIVKITVSNLTSQDVLVHPAENDFIAGDERGTPALILDEGKYAPTHSLKRFMKPLADFTIPANQSKVVEAEIAVPSSAQAGGYFGAIRFAPTTPDSGGQVNLSTSVASLILLTVPGDAVEKLELTDFDIKQGGKIGTFFTTPKNIQVSARFRNDGNVQLGPFGKISVTKGDKLVYDVDFNNADPREMALPDRARRWEIPVEKLEDFGHYKVSATFTYGSKNQTIEIEQSFWVVPMGMIIAIVGGVIGLIVLIAAIWFFLRNYKRRILRNNSHRKRSGYSSSRR